METEKSLTPRLQYLLQHYGERLSMVIFDREGAKYSPIEALSVFSDADPSHNKSATQWLIQSYLGNPAGFLLEDIKDGANSKVFNTLTSFGLHRVKLPTEARDLNRYKLLGDVWDSVEEHVVRAQELAEEAELKSNPALFAGKMKKRAERDKAYRESRILKDQDGVKIIVPMTRFASCWWCKDTRWCTAGTYGNYFAHYHKKGPLIIIITPQPEVTPGEKTSRHHKKIQLHATKDEFQFVNASDTSISGAYVKKHWDVLGDLMIWSAEQNYNAIAFVPKELRNQNMLLNLAKKSYLDFKMFPTSILTDDIWEKLVFVKSSLHKYIPRDKINRKMALHIVSVTRSEINNIPKQYLQDEEILIKGFRDLHNKHKYLNDGICLKLVENHGSNLAHIPLSMRTLELCKVALKTFDGAITDIPKEFLTKEFWNEAFNINYRVFPKIPKEYLTREICWATVEKAGEYIFEVPLRLLDDDILRLALKNIPGMAILNFANKNLRDHNLYQECVEKDPSALELVPNNLKTKDMCLSAVAKDGFQLLQVPNFIKDKEICLEAFRNNYNVTEHFEPVEIKLTQVEKLKINPDFIQEIPKSKQNQAIANVVLEASIKHIRYISDKLISKEVCELAYRENPKLKSYFPARFKKQFESVERRTPRDQIEEDYYDEEEDYGDDADDVTPISITWDTTMLDELQERLNPEHVALKLNI